jgi:hypothetical protein
MFHATGVNCCAAVRDILGCDANDPAGACRGVVANCGDLAAAFATTPLPPLYPDGWRDWTCDAFPNDDTQRDSLIVALISLAVQLPVTLFLAGCFELANENDVPESWLAYGGLARLVLGVNAHRRWQYTGPAAQPRRFVRWYVRSRDAPQHETLANLWVSLTSWITGDVPFWRAEAEDAARAARSSLASASLASVGSVDVDSGGVSRRASASWLPGAPRASGTGSVAGSVADSAAADSAAGGSAPSKHASFVTHRSSMARVASAVRLRRAKRRLTAAGLVGVAIVWVLFAWFIFTCA